jgi:hypothetical protein
MKVGKNAREENDPFAKFFDETFSYPEPAENEEAEEIEEENQVAKGQNLIEILCDSYEETMEHLKKSYQAVCSLDRNLLLEFNLTKGSLIQSLKLKIESAKKEYWQRLFEGLTSINSRLTTESCQKMSSLMNSQTGIDFNSENAYAVVLWVIKNANSYFDSQFISFYEGMMSLVNMEGYVSNKRVFQEDDFYYRYRSSGSLTNVKFKVGHRIVLSRSGGLHKGYSRSGLSNSAAQFLRDTMTIANNLGFDPVSSYPYEYAWDDSEGHEFYCRYEGKTEVLFRVRAFYNGNLHFQFLPEFIHAINIQYGKLKGWLNSSKEVEEELGCPKDLSEKFFIKTLQLEKSVNTLLLK